VGVEQGVLGQAASWQAEGKDLAIATVIRTWGSSPRPVGSQLVVTREGDFVGSVSGGCVEGSVIRESTEVIASGSAKRLHFGVTDEMAWEVGLACGGEVEVYLEKLDPRSETLGRLIQETAAKRGVVLITDLSSGRQWVVPEAGAAGEGPPGELRAMVPDALRRDSSAVAAIAGEEFFLHVFNPPPRLVLVGGVHIAQFLADMAVSSGFEVLVVDPRASFATPERFPGVELSHRWPGEALAALGPDARTAIVTLTHDPKLDDPALQAALASPAFYVGALGSRKTHAARLERLVEGGLAPADTRRIHGPVGLDIGAASPAEIAVSILAEMIGSLRGRES
jgi:xanthine dehydrogenase accessory factor